MVSQSAWSGRDGQPGGLGKQDSYPFFAAGGKSIAGKSNSRRNSSLCAKKSFCAHLSCVLLLCGRVWTHSPNTFFHYSFSCSPWAMHGAPPGQRPFLPPPPLTFKTDRQNTAPTIPFPSPEFLPLSMSSRRNNRMMISSFRRPREDYKWRGEPRPGHLKCASSADRGGDGDPRKFPPPPF